MSNMTLRKFFRKRFIGLFIFFLLLVCFITSTPAYSKGLRARIDRVFKGHIPGRYVVVNATINLRNPTSREIRLDTGSIILVDSRGRSYPAQVTARGNTPYLEPWGHYTYTFPQVVPAVYAYPKSNMTFTASFHLPKNRNPKYIYVIHKGKVLDRKSI
jgi:hypothetical protein